MSFVMATPVAELALKGKSLPAHWEAAYLDHGSYIPGYLIDKHPLLFALCIVAMVSAMGSQWPIRRALSRQIQEGGEPRARMDKIVRGGSVVVAFVLIMLAYKFLVERAIPA
jgi:hypothetical protein